MDKNKLKEFTPKIFKFLLAILLPLSFGLSILSRFFIFAIYGENYLPASVPMSILAFSIPFIVGVDFILASFSAKNKLKNASLLMGISSLIFIVLNYAFIEFSLTLSKESGLLGAAIAALITWMVCFLSLSFLLKRELNIQIVSLWVIKPILSCIVMSLFIVLLLKAFGDMNIFKGIILIFAGAIVYFISLLCIKGIKKEEFFGVLKTFFKKD